MSPAFAVDCLETLEEIAVDHGVHALLKNIYDVALVRDLDAKTVDLGP